jgi:hypothetical protein
MSPEGFRRAKIAANQVTITARRIAVKQPFGKNNAGWKVNHPASR